MRPHGPRVLVRCEPSPDVSGGGIILPEGFTAIEQVSERAGRVIRKGRVWERDLCSSRRDNPRKVSRIRSMMEELQVRDRVLFRKFVGEMNDLKRQWGLTDDDGNDYSIIDIEDILSVIGDDVGVGLYRVKGDTGE